MITNWIAVKKLLCALFLMCCMPLSWAGLSVYTNGETSPPNPAANQRSIDFSGTTLSSEQAAGKLTYSQSLGDCNRFYLLFVGWLCNIGSGIGSVSYGNPLTLTSSTNTNETSVTVNFTNPTPYVGFNWAVEFAAQNSMYVRLTLADNSVVTLRNCVDTNNSQCVGKYVATNWLVNVLNFIFGWVLGDNVVYYDTYVQYQPDNGVKIKSVQFVTQQCWFCGFLSSSTSQNFKVDNLTYVDATVAPHHIEITTPTSSVAQGSSMVYTVTACGNAACTLPYISGMTGTVSITGSGMTPTYTSGPGFTIHAGPNNTATVTASISPGGTATVGLSAYSPTPTNSPAVFCGIGVAAASGNACTLPVTQPLHHLELTTSASSGLTCNPVTYTIKACANAGCSALYTGGAVTGNLSVSGGGATVNYPTGAAFTIASGNSSTTNTAHITTVGTVAASLTSVSPTATGSPAVYCGMGVAAASGNSCNYSAAGSALLFNVGNHVSDVSQAVSVSAVRSSDNATVCTPAFASVSKNVTFKCTYSNPTTGTKPLRVGGAALNASNSTAAACDGTGRAVSLSFNASGVASTTVQYADVGNMGLTGSYIGSGTDAGLIMNGSDSFIAVPASFTISGLTTNPIKAGNPFSATVTAKNNSGATTPNFGKETSVTTDYVRLAWTKYQPTGLGSAPGTLTGTGTSGTPTLSSSAFSGGAATVSNLAWSEVGTGDLSASLQGSTYLGVASTVVTGTTGSTGAAVGPFIPHHFNQPDINTPTVVPALTQGCGTFTYSGQPFKLKLQAVNASDVVTVNYDGTGSTTPNFAKAVTLSDVTNAGTGSLNPAGIPASSFTAGVSNVAVPVFTFTNKLTAATSVTLRATDTDGVDSSAATGLNAEKAVALRSGRIKLSNAFGSNKTTLSVPFQVQYYNGKDWIINSADTCTGSALAASSVAFSNYLDYKGASTAAWTTSVSAVSSISSGNGTLTLSAPTSSGAGSVSLALNLGATTTDQSCLSSHPSSTGANMSWLRAQNGTTNSCSGVTTFDRDPSARVTFGVYSPETQKAVFIRDIH